MSSRLTILRLFCLVATLVVVVSCSKQVTDPNKLATDSTLAEQIQSIFPHSNEFKSYTHGSSYLRNKTLCSTCHGTDFTGGGSQKTCYRCHTEFPHTPSFDHPTVAHSGQASCLNCHLISANGAPPTPDTRCLDCHMGQLVNDNGIVTWKALNKK